MTELIERMSQLAAALAERLPNTQWEIAEVHPEWLSSKGPLLMVRIGNAFEQMISPELLTDMQPPVSLLADYIVARWKTAGGPR